MRTLRIGNGAGFWGDSLDAPRRLVEGARLDYLTLEYLAELTMSILAHQKSRDPSLGYVTDFPEVIESLIPAWRSQPEMKIVTNAGGINPQACAVAVSQRLVARGLADCRVGIVTGDDITARVDTLCAAGEEFFHLKSGEALGTRREHLVSANVYLGADGIVRTLEDDALIVVTGRVADASLTVAPAVHEFGWAWDDWNRLAAATSAGHLIECGAQMTGGICSAVEIDAGSLADIGYPIADLGEDGGVIVTKPDGSGGAVTTETVSEQLIYEIGDPEAYITPDVIADFSNIRLKQLSPDRVAVISTSGRPRPQRLKVSLAWQDGFVVSGTLVICGANAEVKARQSAQIMMERVQRAGFELAETHVEILGAGGSLPEIWPRPVEPFEVVLRVAARSRTREAAERLAREFAPLVTSGPPGVTGYTGSRPRVHPVLSYWPTTVDRSAVETAVEVRSANEWVACHE